jgi:hypothetical protein
MRAGSKCAFRSRFQLLPPFRVKYRAFDCLAARGWPLQMSQPRLGETNEIAADPAKPPQPFRQGAPTRRQVRPPSAVRIRGPAFVSRLRIAKPTRRVGKEGVESGAVPTRFHVLPLSLVRMINAEHGLQALRGWITAQASSVPGMVATCRTATPRQRIDHVLPPSDVLDRYPCERSVGP